MFCFVSRSKNCFVSSCLGGGLCSIKRANWNGFEYGLIAHGTKFEWTEKPHSYFLDNNDIGPYTVCRTVNKYNIFKYKMHINRLIHTIYENWKTYHCDNNNNNKLLLKPKLSQSALYKTITNTLYFGLNSFYSSQTHKNDNKETRIMIYIDQNKLFDYLCNNGNNNGDIDDIDNIFKQCMITHFCYLPELIKPIRAIIRCCKGNEDELHKFEPLQKDSKWWRDKKLWENKEIDEKLGINEVLMYNKNDGYILEGVSSTFGIFKNDGNLYTPSLNMAILDGTVRSFIIDILNQYDDINIIYKPPKLKEINCWKAAVIMSTSRMLLPIDELYIDIYNHHNNDNKQCIKFDNDNNEHLKQFQLFTNNKILDHSTLITHI